MKRLSAAGAFLAVSLSSTLAVAQVESLRVASDLGSVLGAEAGCGLKYDQAAIKAYVDAKVKPDDMQFPTLLRTMSQGSAVQLKSMSESEKTAYCTQVKRVAIANKFIKP